MRELTKEQSQVLKYSFLKIALKADIVADLFYFRFLELQPELKSVFEFTNRLENNRSLIYMIKAMITSIDEPLQLHYILKDKLTKEEDLLFLKNLDTASVALIWALQRALTTNFTEEVRESWIAAVELISDVINDQSVLLNKIS